MADRDEKAVDNDEDWMFCGYSVIYDACFLNYDLISYPNLKIS